jgi:hypothetical protein
VGHADFLGGTGEEDFSTELLAWLRRPLSGALVDRNDELGDSAQDLEDFGFSCFHVFSKQQKILIAMSS